MQVIDALLITLGLDTKKLEENSKKAQESLKQTGEKGAKNLSEIDVAGKKAAEVLVKMKNEALTLASIMLGGMGVKEFVAHTTQANIQAGNFSRNIGMSVNELNAWKRAADAAGGSADDMQGALGAMNDALQTYKLQGKFTGPLEYFAALGISARDAKGNLISAGEAMLRISNAIQRRPMQDQASILQKMGFGSGVTPLLSKGPSDIQAALAEMRKLGDATNDAFESSKKLNAEWVKFKASIESAGVAIQHSIDTPLLNTLHTMTQVAQAVKSIAEGKPADPTLARKQQNAVRSQNSWLWDTLFGSSLKPAAVSGKVKEESGSGVANMLLAAGWSAAQANGIISNLMHESGLNPAAVGDGGKAYGIAQWHPDRQADFKAWSGKSIVGSSLADQIAFMNYELTKGKESAAGARLRGATSAGDAASLMALLYERPADAVTKARQRAAYASSMPIGAGVRAGAGGATIETNIGQITINTKAIDADGLARDMKGAISRHAQVAQANSGVN